MCFHGAFLRSGNAGFTKSRRVIGEHVSHPLVGWRSSDQDGWGLRSNLICRGIFEDFHAGSKGNLYSKIETPRNRLGKTDVLLLDDWGLATLTAEQRRDLLEILEDRHGSRSTIVTSQLPLDQWPVSYTHLRAHE